MKVNWRRFAIVFVLLDIVMLCSGCTPGWIGVASTLLTALVPAVNAILAFVMSLEGKTIPPSVEATIQKIIADIQAGLQVVQTLISEVQSGGQTVIAQIDSALNGVVTNLNSILSALSITDPATVAKITEIVGAVVTGVEAILAVVPVAQAKLSEPAAEAHLHAFDKVVSGHMANAHATLQQSYADWLSSETANTVVNVALDGVTPRQLP